MAKKKPWELSEAAQREAAKRAREKMDAEKEPEEREERKMVRISASQHSKAKIASALSGMTLTDYLDNLIDMDFVRITSKNPPG